MSISDRCFALDQFVRLSTLVSMIHKRKRLKPRPSMKSSDFLEGFSIESATGESVWVWLMRFGMGRVVDGLGFD